MADLEKDFNKVWAKHYCAILSEHLIFDGSHIVPCFFCWELTPFNALLTHAESCSSWLLGAAKAKDALKKGASLPWARFSGVAAQNCPTCSNPLIFMDQNGDELLYQCAHCDSFLSWMNGQLNLFTLAD